MKKIIFLLLFPSLSSFAQKLEPSETMAKFNIEVVNEKKKPQEGETVTFESRKTKKTYTGVTTADGKFSLLVPKGDKYQVKYKALTMDKDYTTLDVPNVKTELYEFDVTIEFEHPKKYTLDNVYFETGKADLKPSSFKEINELVEYMKLKKTMVIEIAGHTDNVGTAEANLILSMDRANSVRTYLNKKGINEIRVQAKGYGDTQPVAPNDTEANKQKNRRTEVRVIKE